MGYPEGFEGKHRGKHCAKNDADTELRRGDPLSPCGHQHAHDGRGKQHPHRQQRHHGTRSDQFFGDEIGRPPGGGHEKEQQINAETGEKNGHSTIVDAHKQ